MTVLKEKTDILQILQLQKSLQTSEQKEYQILGDEEQLHFVTEACEKSPPVKIRGSLCTCGMTVYDFTLACFASLLLCLCAALSSKGLILTLPLQGWQFIAGEFRSACKTWE